MRFENLKNGQMDILSLGNVKLVANEKCQDLVYKFKSNLRNGDHRSHKNTQSKRRDPNEIFLIRPVCWKQGRKRNKTIGGPY